MLLFNGALAADKTAVSIFSVDMMKEAWPLNYKEKNTETNFDSKAAYSAFKKRRHTIQMTNVRPVYIYINQW